MTNEDYKQLEPAARDVAQPTDPIAFSIAVSLKRLADASVESTEHLEQIRAGYRFICERWGSR